MRVPDFRLNLRLANICKPMGSTTMKLAFLAALALSAAISFPAYAQTTSSSGSLSQSGASIQINNPGSVKSAPPVAAPGLAAASVETCLGSSSGGLSGMGFGIAFGSTNLDKGCEARLDARTLYGMGLRDAAMYRLCDQPKMALAMAQAGVLCPQYRPRQVSVRHLPTLTLAQAKRLSSNHKVFDKTTGKWL